MKTILSTACLLFLFVQGLHAQPPCGDKGIPGAAVPILKEAYKDSLHYDKAAVQYALARLGDTAAESRIYSSFTLYRKADYPRPDRYMDRMNKLLFIANQQSVYHIAQLMDTSLSYVAEFVDPGPHIMALTSGILVKELSIGITNPELKALCLPFAGEQYILATEENKRTIIRVRDWILQNRGKYTINPNYYLYRF